jgi:hypothetical protein
VLRQVAGAAGDIEGRSRRQLSQRPNEGIAVVEPRRPLARGEQPGPLVPLVVLGSALFVVGLQSASCWYAIDWNDMRCSGETPSFSIAARCSGVE